MILFLFVLSGDEAGKVVAGWLVNGRHLRRSLFPLDDDDAMMSKHRS